MIYVAVAVGIASGFFIGAATMCALAGRKVTRAEIDRRERAARAGLRDAFGRDTP